MKNTRERLWDLSAEAHYARHLTSCSASVTANDLRTNRGASPLWTTGDETLRLVLATAFNLQPRRWSFSLEEMAAPEMGDAQ